MSSPHACMLSLHSCLTLFDPMDCSPPVSSVHGDSVGQNTGVGCHFLLQGVFSTRGSNPRFSTHVEPQTHPWPPEPGAVCSGNWVFIELKKYPSAGSTPAEQTQAGPLSQRISVKWESRQKEVQEGDSDLSGKAGGADSL